MAAATRRLLKELAANAADPNPALDVLEPVSEEDIFTWRAVLKGAPGTPYEGMSFGRLPIPPVESLANGAQAGDGRSR